MSRFYVMAPLTVDENNLDSTNVAEADAAAWDIATTYNSGDQVMYEHAVYESTTDSNLGNQPDTSTANWLFVSVTNRYKAFDALINTQTENADTVEYEITPGQIVNGIGFFNVTANSIQVTVTDPVEGVVYDETQELFDDSLIVDWHAYFFEPVDRGTRAFFSDLPQYTSATVDIVVDNTGSTAAVGAIAMGEMRDMGGTLFGTSFGILDFSRKERDEFGNFSITERSFADRVSYSLDIDTGSANRIKRVLRALRATPAVYIGAVDREELIVYGFYKDWTTVLDNYASSSVSIEVEGLI